MQQLFSAIFSGFVHAWPVETPGAWVARSRQGLPCPASARNLPFGPVLKWDVKRTSLVLAVAGAALMAGCQTSPTNAPREGTAAAVKHRPVELEQGVAPAPAATVYNDQRIAMIQRGRTTEAELVQWFGPPVSRDVGADGRARLNWSFEPAPGEPGNQPSSGALAVRLSAKGTVESYSARRAGR